MTTKLSQAEFDELVELHAQWVGSDEKAGKWLKLSKRDCSGLVANNKNLAQSVWSSCDLSSMSFVDADLTDARFHNCKLSKADFSSATLNGCEITECDADEATFARADVIKANFSHSTFRDANFREVEGNDPHFQWVTLSATNFADAIIEQADFRHAKLDSSTFEDANLKGADFDLSSAEGIGAVVFRGVNAQNATFLQADLTGADFEGAVLEDADFDAAKIEDTDFRKADVTDADFRRTTGSPSYPPDYDDFTGCQIAGSEMHPLFEGDVDDLLSYVGYETCSFDHGGIKYRIVGTGYGEPIAIVSEDALESEVEEFWTETEPNDDGNSEKFMYAVSELNEYDGTLRAEGAEDCGEDEVKDVGVNVPRATEAQVEDVLDSLEEEGDLSGWVRRHLDIEEYGDGVWIGGGEISWGELKPIKEKLEELLEAEPVETRELTSYGKSRPAVEQLRKVTKEMKVAAFKRTFPKAFESVKTQLRGATISPELARTLIEQFGMTWLVSETAWSSDLQRLCPCPNEVLQFNVDLAALSSDDKVLKTLLAIRRMCLESLHPVVSQDMLMTVGWVRFCSFPGKNGIWALGTSQLGVLPSKPGGEPPPKLLLVEEVQSDLPTVRKGMEAEGEFRDRLMAQGNKEVVDDALRLMQPFVDRFYQDALAAIFDLAAERGIDRVEMFTHETKKQFGSPMNIYEKLPKSMGMKKVAGGRSQHYVDALKRYPLPPIGDGPSHVEPKVWAIQVVNDNPGRRKSARKRMPKTWTRFAGFR
jgi:uncharacterized protein YjbI with pentapeptide repeats